MLPRYDSPIVDTVPRCAGRHGKMYTSDGRDPYSVAAFNFIGGTVRLTQFLGLLKHVVDMDHVFGLLWPSVLGVRSGNKMQRVNSPASLFRQELLHRPH